VKRKQIVEKSQKTRRDHWGDNINHKLVVCNYLDIGLSIYLRLIKIKIIEFLK